MPQNSTGQLAIWQDALGVVEFDLSPQDTGVRVHDVQDPQTLVRLPGVQPNDGDTYVIVDADGSASADNAIVIEPPTGTTIQGGASVAITSAFGAALVVFDGDESNWTVSFFGGQGSSSGASPWTDVPAGSTFTTSAATPFLSCDSSGAQTTIEVPPASFNGQNQTVRATGAMNSPVIVEATGSGWTIEQLNDPGTFAASTWLPIQGQSVVFKADTTTKQWKLFAQSLSGTPGQSSYNAGWFARTDVYWDPAGTHGGSNANSGGVGFPVLTWAEITRRYGGIFAVMNYGQSVRIHQLSAQPAGADPIFAEFECSGGGQAILDTTAAWTNPGANFAAGALGGGFGFAGAVATAGGTPMTIAGVPGYVVAGTILFNPTRTSYTVVKSVGGGTATCGQPQTSATLMSTATLPAPAVDNDWVAGNLLTPITATPCNLKRFSAKGGDVSAGGQPSGVWVIGASFPDTSVSGASELAISNIAACTVFVLCSFPVRTQLSSLEGRGNVVYLLGCYHAGAVAVFGILGSMFGCVVTNGVTAVGGLLVQNNTCISGAVNAASSLAWGGVTVHDAWSDSTWSAGPGAKIEVTSGPFWGSWSVVLDPNATMWNGSGSTWVLAAALTTGTLKFGSLTVGTPPSVGGTFALNGVTAVNVAPAGGQHFPANAKIAWSLNAVGGTPGVGSPYFSAAQTADQFTVKSPTALANDTYAWQAFDGSVAINPANLDLYNGLYDEASGARFCNTQ